MTSGMDLVGSACPKEENGEPKELNVEAQLDLSSLSPFSFLSSLPKRQMVCEIECSQESSVTFARFPARQLTHGQEGRKTGKGIRHDVDSLHLTFPSRFTLPSLSFSLSFSFLASFASLPSLIPSSFLLPLNSLRTQSCGSSSGELESETSSLCAPSAKEISVLIRCLRSNICAGFYSL